jgi:hypothetical protein
MAQHPETGRDVFESFANILAEPCEFTTAVRATRLLGKVFDDLARQMGGQRTASTLRSGSEFNTARRMGFDLGDILSFLVQVQLKLGDLLVQFLRTFAEEHPLVFLNDQFQVLNLTLQ